MQQKLVKIADRSKYGCKVVAEYKADEHASDSKDEEKLKKAKKSTERKALKNRKAATRPANKHFSSKFRQPSMGSYALMPWSPTSSAHPSEKPTSVI